MATRATTRHAIDLDRQQRALARFVTAVLGSAVSVQWADQPEVRRALPLVELSWLRPPARRGHDVERLRDAPKVVEIEVLDAVDGREYIVDVNAYFVRRRADGVLTAEDLLDGLVEDLEASLEPIDVTKTSASTLTIEGLVDGGLWRVAAYPPGSCDATVLERVDVLEVLGERLSTLRIDAFTKKGVGGDTADELVATLDTAIRSATWRTELRQHGIAVWGPPAKPRDVSFLASAHRERRVQLELQIACRARLLIQSDPDTIDQVGYAGEVAAGAFVHEIATTTPPTP